MKKICLPVLFSLYWIILDAQTTLYYNGKIFTADTSHPFNSFFIVENGMITRTGDTISADSILLLKNKFNLDGKLVLPGIIDSHIHFIDGSLGLLQLSLSDVTDSTMLKEKLMSSRNQLLDGTYVARDLGFEALSNVESPLKLLDEIFTEVPVIIFLKSGHAAIANSKGMKKLGFTNKTIIKDGSIQKDKNGNLNGWLFEAAAMEASKQITSTYSDKTIVEAIMKGQSLALSYGITTIGDNTFSPYHLKIYQTLQHQGDLKMKIWARSYGRIPETDNLMKGMGVKKMGFIGAGTDFNRVHYHAIKLFEDMSLSVPHDLTDSFEPGGTVFLNPKQLKDYFLLFPERTFAFHVQGKKGIQNILDALDEIGSRNNHLRHVIDHAGYVSNQQLEKIAQSGLSLTILASQTFDYPSLVHDYKRSSAKFIEDDLLNAKIKFNIAHGALTSDFPYGMDTVFTHYKQVDGLNPFANMAVNITGKYPDGTAIDGFQNKTLSVNEALQSYTANGAYVLNAENSMGKIAPGFKADFIILKKDVLSQDAIQLYNTKVEQTFVNGEKVFDRNDSNVTADNKVRKDKIKPYDHTFSPIFGYDPTVGFIFGAAAFVFPLQTPGHYFDIQMQASAKGNISLIGNYMRYGMLRNIDFKLSATYTDFVQYHFGEGDSTKGDNYIQLFSNRFYARPEFILNLPDKFKLNLFVDYRGRKEIKTESKNGEQIAGKIFPDENTMALGTGISFDTRDNSFNTKKGFFVNASIAYIPSSLNVQHVGDATLINGDVRYFHYLYSSKFVFAGRISGGTTKGTSSYLFRYTLGGANQLRGYYSNRFRGEKFYAMQAELRFSLYGKFSGVGFVDAGDITDNSFNKIKSTYGGGIRFSIRDNVSLRLDYGFGRDQNGLFFTFGEAF